MASTDTLDPELFLPEPPAEEIHTTVISVDDHLVEPRHLFEGRLETKYQDLAPKIVEMPNGMEVWTFDGEFFTQVGLNAVVGRRPESVHLEPFRFDQMRPGCYDPAARVADMDLCGVWASLNFPSQCTGFCGRVYSQCSDPALGLAVTKAFNDWYHEEWVQAHPGRFIGNSISFLTDPAAGAAEIRRNAERGCTSVTLPERPHKIDLPPIFDVDYWDPIIRACAETDTVISLHVGSTGVCELPEGCPPTELAATLFGQLSMTACAEWLWAGWPRRYPDLKIAMSEGGIGWVAMLLDRLDNMVTRSGYAKGWGDDLPADVLKRNFWFCTIDDPSTIDTRHRIGLDHIMFEVDYPHGDSTWPNVQQVITEAWGHLSDDEIRTLCSGNAAALYRHPLPDVVLPA